MKSEEQPDMIMMSQYADIDLNGTPIVILSCGHFFTTETLDGLVGLKDVYSLNATTGLFNGLIENAELSASVPQCPNCREPIKQYVTQRYNRLINRAVIDDMSKRFIVNGQQELQQIEDQLENVRKELEESRKTVVPEASVKLRGEINPEFTMQYINDGIKNRSFDTARLLNDVKAFRRSMDIQHQPTYKLHQATLHMIARNDSLDTELAKLSIASSEKSAKRDRDQRITLGGSLLEIKVRCLVLEDSFEIMRAVNQKHLRSTVPLSFAGGSPIAKTDQFLKDTKKLVDDCIRESLPKLAVEAILHYARIAQSFSGAHSGKNIDRAKAISYRTSAKELLTMADKLCNHSFRGRDNFRQAITAASSMLNKEFYEAVSKEELESIKKAMVSGRGGIATHSGHWYKCVNGHPVSRLRFHFTEYNLTQRSSLSESVACLCSSRVVQNVESQLVASTMLLLQEYRVQLRWSTEKE
jgi:type 1 glutamine amidotransferase